MYEVNTATYEVWWTSETDYGFENYFDTLEEVKAYVRETETETKTLHIRPRWKGELV